MTTYSRLSTVLGGKQHYPLGEDCSFRREVVKLGIFNIPERCPLCKGTMKDEVIGIESNDFTRTSRIVQWYGPCCVECGVVSDNSGDIN